MEKSNDKKVVKLMERFGTEIPRGDVYIIKERCKGCRYCIEFCPQGVLKESEEFNAKGHHPPMMKEDPPLKVCNGCGFCTLICPEFAIYSKPRGEKKGEKNV